MMRTNTIAPGWYPRLLRLRYLRVRPAVGYVFGEGSMVLGGTLALADVTPWWGAVAIPVSVALMVKFNDVIAAALDRAADNKRASAATSRRPRAVGRSSPSPVQVRPSRARLGPWASENKLSVASEQPVNRRKARGVASVRARSARWAGLEADNHGRFGRPETDLPPIARGGRV